MNPDVDRQPSRNPWPWPDDTPLDRARRLLMACRARLGALSKPAQQEFDDMCRSYGETWMLPATVVTEPDQELTTAEAAELVKQSRDTIRKWACMPHPEKQGEPLLPRFKMRGRERTYLAADVLAAAAALRRAQRLRTSV